MGDNDFRVGTSERQIIRQKGSGQLNLPGRRNKAFRSRDLYKCAGGRDPNRHVAGEVVLLKRRLDCVPARTLRSDRAKICYPLNRAIPQLDDTVAEQDRFEREDTVPIVTAGILKFDNDPVAFFLVINIAASTKVEVVPQSGD